MGGGVKGFRPGGYHEEVADTERQEHHLSELLPVRLILRFSRKRGLWPFRRLRHGRFLLRSFMTKSLPLASDHVLFWLSRALLHAL